MTRTTITRIRYRYGRLVMALALVAGGVAIGLSAEPRGVTADSMPAPTPVSPVATTTTSRTPTIDSFQSVLSFGQVFVIYTYHPDVDRSCWSVHDVEGDVLGIFADQQALETLFPEVDSSELLYAAIRNARHGN